MWANGYVSSVLKRDMRTLMELFFLFQKWVLPWLTSPIPTAILEGNSLRRAQHHHQSDILYVDPFFNCDFFPDRLTWRLLVSMHIIGGDWAGDASVYAASGCPSTCVGSRFLLLPIQVS